VLPGEDAAWHVRLLEQSVVVPGPVTEQLGTPARQAGVHLVMGVDEREEHGSTVYNTLLYFGPDGRLLGKHRKLMPTHAGGWCGAWGTAPTWRCTRPRSAGSGG
jgi:predicted amidohydrolase